MLIFILTRFNNNILNILLYFMSANNSLFNNP
jgi:hypothetical protein